MLTQEINPNPQSTEKLIITVPLMERRLMLGASDGKQTPPRSRNIDEKRFPWFHWSAQQADAVIFKLHRKEQKL
ncbi:Hypothetical predicted protein [Podarcis lilfordi]|uniref:Uncharacterized protein n=1 Tax=Podarcis lilfordi TaxID=74358 RepID=A0AA35KC55_9SAUR|nr:Hypothetical predicted protein [Podarcis lilfordi]